MESTFYLEGPSAKERDKVAIGSGMVVTRPCGAIAPDLAAYVLITAAHVLNEISGDSLRLMVRTKQSDGTWQKKIHPVKIRDQGRDRYVKHPAADVAALYTDLPEGVATRPPPIAAFATDSMLERFQIHPGDEVFALGFPLGAPANESGFPILRSGRIASFPLLPQSRTKTFLVDMDTFPGNSGGPVYLWDRHRFYDGAFQMGEIRLIMGLVTGQAFARETRLRITEVVHSNFVLETVLRLPAPDCARK
jgi:S1-C subfamily serine protease